MVNADELDAKTNCKQTTFIIVIGASYNSVKNNK